MPLLSLIPGRALIIGAAVVVALIIGLYVVGQLKRVGKLEGQLDASIELSNQNAEIAEKQRAEMERLQGIDAENAKLRARLRRASDDNRRAISNAPPSDDGPLAPVLRRQLDSLRGDEGPNAADRAAAPAYLVPIPGAMPGAVPPRP